MGFPNLLLCITKRRGQNTTKKKNNTKMSKFSSCFFGSFVKPCIADWSINDYYYVQPKINNVTKYHVSHSVSLERDMVRIVCIGNTFGLYDRINLPMGDILVHTGGIFSKNLANASVDLAESLLQNFADWLHAQPHRFKVVVGGSSDHILEILHPRLVKKILGEAIYLCNTSAVVCGLVFYGSPNSVDNSGITCNQSKLRCSSSKKCVGAAFAKKEDEKEEDTSCGWFGDLQKSADVIVTHENPLNSLNLYDNLVKAAPRLNLCGKQFDGHSVANLTSNVPSICCSLLDNSNDDDTSSTTKQKKQEEKNKNKNNRKNIHKVEEFSGNNNMSMRLPLVIDLSK